MAKHTVSLLVALAAISAAGATISGRQARSRRFLASSDVYNPPLPSSYGCSKKSVAVCLAPGSPGPTCCGGQCIDTHASADHCGGCNKVCKYGRTCCGGRCVDLLSDKDNRGKCSNQCNKKCSYGFYNYA